MASKVLSYDFITDLVEKYDKLSAKNVADRLVALEIAYFKDFKDIDELLKAKKVVKAREKFLDSLALSGAIAGSMKNRFQDNIIKSLLKNQHLLHITRELSPLNWVSPSVPISNIISETISGPDTAGEETASQVSPAKLLISFLQKHGANINASGRVSSAIASEQYPLDIALEAAVLNADQPEVVGFIEFLVSEGARELNVKYWKDFIKTATTTGEFPNALPEGIELLRDLFVTLDIEQTKEEYRPGFGEAFLKAEQQFKMESQSKDTLKRKRRAEEECTRLEKTKNLSELQEIARTEGVPFSKKRKSALCWDLAVHFTSWSTMR